MKDLANYIIIWLLGLVGTLITTVLLPCLANYIKSKTQNEKLQSMIEELSSVVASSVNYVNQTFVEQLKKDGCFDKEKQQEALAQATSLVFQTLTEKTKQFVQDSNIDLQLLIEKKIESYLFESKNK